MRANKTLQLIPSRHALLFTNDPLFLQRQFQPQSAFGVADLGVLQK
jgi:hypothetical protein